MLQMLYLFGQIVKDQFFIGLRGFFIGSLGFYRHFDLMNNLTYHLKKSFFLMVFQICMKKCRMFGSLIKIRLKILERVSFLFHNMLFDFYF